MARRMPGLAFHLATAVALFGGFLSIGRDDGGEICKRLTVLSRKFTPGVVFQTFSWKTTPGVNFYQPLQSHLKPHLRHRRHPLINARSADSPHRGQTSVAGAAGFAAVFPGSKDPGLRVSSFMTAAILSR